MVIKKIGSRGAGPGERIEAPLRNRSADQVGLYLFARGFCARNTGMSLEEFYTDPEKNLEAQIWTARMYGNDESLKFGFASSIAWDFGGHIKMPSAEFDQTPMVVRYPVQSEADGWNLEIPDVESAGMVPANMTFSRLQEKKGLVKTVSIGAPFMNAANMCGFENLLKWVYKKPDLARHLIQLATEYGVRLARYWVETFGPENIEFRTSTPTSSNQVISPKHFQAFSLPYLKELHEKVLGMGVRHLYTHICGEQNLNLPYYREVPFGDPGIVSFGHEVDLTRAIEVLGDRCIIVGNVEPRIILLGTPDEVYAASKECILKGKKAERGFMLGPGCELPPMAPACNVWAMRKAVDDFG